MGYPIHRRDLIARRRCAPKRGIPRMMQAQCVTHLVGDDFLELTVVAKTTGRKRIKGEVGLERSVKGYAVHHSRLVGVVTRNARDRENAAATISRSAEISITVVERDRIRPVDYKQTTGVRRSTVYDAQRAACDT